MLASQELQIGRCEIERVGNATVHVISSVVPRGDVVDGGSPGDILCCRFGTDVGFVVYVELTDPDGKTGRGDKWTSEIDLTEGVRLRFGPRSDGLGVKLANREALREGRHCVLQEMCEAGKEGVISPGLWYCLMVIWIEFWEVPHHDCTSCTIPCSSQEERGYRSNLFESSKCAPKIVSGRHIVTDRKVFKKVILSCRLISTT